MLEISKVLASLGEIAPTAVVSDKARIGKGVSVGHGTVVYDDVELMDGTVVGDHCSIGVPVEGDPPLRVGEGSLIRSHSVLYQGADLGAALETGHHVLIRSGVSVGTNLRLGSFSSLEGNLSIGDYGRIQGYAQLGPGSKVGDFVWIFSLCILTNDPLPPSGLFEPVTIEDAAVICPGVLVMPGCRVGRGAFVAAGARVSGEVPVGALVGPDGEVSGRVDRLMNLESGLRHPWLRHFTDGYPAEAQPRLAALREEILAALKESREAEKKSHAAR